MKFQRILPLLLLSTLMLNSTAVSQTRNKSVVTIIYNDGARVEVTNWIWEYTGTKLTERKSKKRRSLGDPGDSTGGSRPYAKPETFITNRQWPDSKEYAREPIIEQATKLVISLAALSDRGVFLNKLELAEAELSYIKFIWKPDETSIEKVIIALTNGRTIELPELIPALPDTTQLYLKGDASLQGFKGWFSARVGGNSPDRLGRGKNSIVEIRFR